MLVEVKRGSWYRQKQTQLLHQVLSVATHTERDEVIVCHRAVMSAGTPQQATPLDLFKEQFEKLS